MLHKNMDILLSTGLLFCGLMNYVDCYCTGVGANPGFTAGPQVHQVDMTKVLVTWNGIVTRKDCADQFLVKSWEYMDPNNYQISKLLPTDRSSVVVEGLTPQIEYVFQVVAREDKGFLGKDWNKSPPIKFIIMRNNPTVPPPNQNQPEQYPIPNSHSDQGSSNSAMPGSPAAVRPPEEVEGDGSPLSIVIVVFISSTIVIITIIVTGAIYNMIRMANRKRRRNDSGSFTSSSLDLDITNENLVSWRQSRRDLMESTRILAQNSKQSNSSMIDLTNTKASRKISQTNHEPENSRKVSPGGDTVDLAKSRASSWERRSQGTQTPGALCRTPCCQCSKSPMLDRKPGVVVGQDNTDTDPLNRDNDPDIEFIDDSMDASGYASVVRTAGLERITGGLERISDHTEDEDKSENGNL